MQPAGGCDKVWVGLGISGMERGETYMRKYIVTALILGLASFGWAEGEADLQPHMKTFGGTMGKMRKDAEANSAAEIAKGAATMQATFKEVSAFFSKRGVMDAVKMADDGAAASAELLAAANAGNAEGIKTAMGKVGATCGGCHKVHREQVGEGQYKIK
jgi:cytochrome c556